VSSRRGASLIPKTTHRLEGASVIPKETLKTRVSSRSSLRLYRPLLTRARNLVDQDQLDSTTARLKLETSNPSSHNKIIERTLEISLKVA